MKELTKGERLAIYKEVHEQLLWNKGCGFLCGMIQDVYNHKYANTEFLCMKDVINVFPEFALFEPQPCDDNYRFGRNVWFTQQVNFGEVIEVERLICMGICIEMLR
jgi:hypothetical protein